MRTVRALVTSAGVTFVLVASGAAAQPRPPTPPGPTIVTPSLPPGAAGVKLAPRPLAAPPTVTRAPVVAAPTPAPRALPKLDAKRASAFASKPTLSPPKPGADPRVRGGNLSASAGSSREIQIATEGASVYVVWSEQVGFHSDIVMAVSDDGGESFFPPFRLTDQSALARKPVVAAAGPQVVVLWEEGVAGGQTSRVGRVVSGDRGATFGPVERPSGAEHAAAPRVVASGLDTFEAWFLPSARSAVVAKNGKEVARRPSVLPSEISADAFGAVAQVVYGVDPRYPGSYTSVHFSADRGGSWRGTDYATCWWQGPDQAAASVRVTPRLNPAHDPNVVVAVDTRVARVNAHHVVRISADVDSLCNPRLGVGRIGYLGFETLPAGSSLARDAWAVKLVGGFQATHLAALLDPFGTPSIVLESSARTTGYGAPQFRQIQDIDLTTNESGRFVALGFTSPVDSATVARPIVVHSNDLGATTTATLVATSSGHARGIKVATAGANVIAAWEEPGASGAPDVYVHAFRAVDP